MNRLSDATLNGMTKKQLIEYVRMCEHNLRIAEETLRQQAENVKDWRPVKHGHWVEVRRHRDADGCIVTDYKCSECGIMLRDTNPDDRDSEFYCYHCGADMRGDADGDQV